MDINQRVEDLDSSVSAIRKPSKPSGAFDRFAPPVSADIEVLLRWTYATQQVHRREREGMIGVSTGGMDSVLRVERNAIQGGRISGGFAPGLPMGGAVDEVHPDALTVHACVAIMDNRAIEMVLTHASMRTRPNWGGPLRLLRPLRKGNGKIKMLYDNAQHPIASLLDPDDLEHNATVLHHHAAWVHWWVSLLILQDECAANLPHLNVTGPSAPRFPWLNPSLVIKWLDDAKKL